MSEKSGIKVLSTFLYFLVSVTKVTRIKNDSRCWAQETGRMRLPFTAINKNGDRNLLERWYRELSLGYVTFAVLVRLPYNNIK